MLLVVKVLVGTIKALIALVKPFLVNTKGLLVMRQPLQFPPEEFSELIFCPVFSSSSFFSAQQ